MKAVMSILVVFAIIVASGCFAEKEIPPRLVANDSPTVCPTITVHAGQPIPTNGPIPTRVGWSVRVCNISGAVGERIAFRFGLNEDSANDYRAWDWYKLYPQCNDYSVSGGSSEKDFPGGLIGPEKIWIKADNDPHNFDSEVCVLFGGVVKQGMTFTKDQTKDVENTDSGTCHC